MPIAETIVARILGDLAISSLKVVLSLGANEADDSLLPWSVALKDPAGTIVGILSGDQAEDAANFLRTAEVANLCQAHFLCRLGAVEHYSTREIQDDISAAFVHLARRWCSEKPTDWSSLAEDIWSQIALYLEEALPAEEILTALDSTDIYNFRENMEPTLSAQYQAGIGPRFLRELVDVSLNLDRIDAVQNNAADIRRHFADYYKQIRIDHAQHDYRIEIDQLYVDRDLIDWENRDRIASSAIFSDSCLPRIVVTGDPGVGKSTFTEYLIWTLTQEGPTRYYAPLIVNCREYAVAHDAAILSVIKDKIANDLHLRYSDEDIEDIMIMGRAFVIIDGVDEILDLSRRRELIRRIEALAKRFPLCPIIATTRNIGYEQARFDNIRFKRYELEEFTQDQIEEYVRRWFSLTARNESDLDGFLVELGSIPDLRSNPLMLSLLCILYRARGHIPRNRRQIYSQCADLLFNRWDRMRHIEQPYDHTHYGDELMQEIAIWFYRSQAAQAGLEEQQIRKVIALFLVDAAGVPETAANQRATAFLDFCADRAWLLGIAGTNERGQRLFVFTHRTFMEFFAAESIARTYDIEKIASEVAENYEKDASSVLPDLLVQSAEVHRRGGARDIITNLFEIDRTRAVNNPGQYLPLCLRILNLSPVNPRLVEQVFKRTLTLWEQKNASDTRLSAIAALDMYRDPRNKFMEFLQAGSECLENNPCVTHNSHPIELFLVRWANLYHTTSMAEYQDDWGDFVDENARRTLPHLLSSSDNALKHFLISEGYTRPVDKTIDIDILVTGAFGQTVPGYGLQSLYRVLGNNPRDNDLHIVQTLARKVYRRRKKIPIFYTDMIFKASRVGSHFISRSAPRTEFSEAYLRDIETLVLWVACAAYESEGTITLFHDSTEGFLGLNYRSLFSTRDAYIDGEIEELQRDEAGTKWLGILDQEELKAICHNRPSWFASWCRGATNLTRDPSQNASDFEEEGSA